MVNLGSCIGIVTIIVELLSIMSRVGSTCSVVCEEAKNDVTAQNNRSELKYSDRPFITLVPQRTHSDPLVVYTEIYLEDLNSFKPVTMDFRLDFFLKHRWTVEGNLCATYVELLNQRTGQSVTEEERPVIVSVKEVTQMWLPDTYIGNSKVVETPAKDSSTSFLMIRRKNDVCILEYTLRLAAIVSCQMDFKDYPVDIQVCPFNLRSFSYPREMVVYTWDQDGPPPINPEMKMLRHRVTLTKGKAERHMLNATYSMLYVNLTFERDLAHHLIQVFTPSALIVMLSWLSFWLGLEATPGRITLCVTSLLALITQFSSIRRDLPPLSYIHGVDIWIVTCMCFVFASLLEFTVVIYLDRRQKRQGAPRLDILTLEASTRQSSTLKDVKRTHHPIYTNNKLLKHSAWNAPETRSPRRLRNKKARDWVLTIDQASRFLFPLGFLLFNTFYWPALLSRDI